MQRSVPAVYHLTRVGLYRSWGISTGQSRAQWEAFEQQLQRFQAGVDQRGGPFLMGSEVSLVGFHVILRKVYQFTLSYVSAIQAEVLIMKCGSQAHK